MFVADADNAGPVTLLTSIAALLAVLAFAMSAWGWGRMVLHACRLEAGSAIAYPAVLGLAALAAIGGWLNVFAIAYPPTLWALLLIGWVAAAHRIYAGGVHAWKPQRRSELLYGGVIALAALCLGLAVLPAGAFNPWDDFLFYIPRPVRMLQVGTFGHDPFDSLGLESLGTQAFLQAFTLLAFGPAFLNAFDAVLCATLSLGLVATIGRRLEVHPAICLGALLALMLLHPQQVNLSALYSIAMFSLAVVPAAAHLVSAGRSSVPPWTAALPVGLLFAAIAGSKATTVTILISLPSLLLLLFGLTYGWRFALSAAGKVVALAAVFVLPWIALSADKYLQWVGGRTERVWLGPVTSPLRLLTDTHLYWGGAVRIYTGVAAFILAVTVVALLKLRPSSTESSGALRISLTALCAAAALTYILNTVPHDLRHTVRYSIPMLLAAVPGAVLLGGRLLAGVDGGRRPGTARAAAALIFACAVPLTLAILFAMDIKDRAWNAVTSKALLTFPRGAMEGYAEHTAYGLSFGVQMARGAQAQVEPGERILALIAFPHNLLFARNSIFVAFDEALFWPWLDVPQNADGAQMRRFLHSYGIRYVIWQRAGRGVHSEAHLFALLNEDLPLSRDAAKRALSFRRSMSDLFADAPKDAPLLIVDLGKPPAVARR